ncbi:MAG: LysM peptidoglycan-binding domain-containing protein [Anaerolineales bacterium]
MNKSRMLFFIIIISSLMFSACTMSASTPPPVTPTTNLSEIARQATETAIAKTPKTGETQVPEATQEGEIVATSTASGVEEPTSTPKSTKVPKTSVPDPVEYAVPDSYTLHEGEFVWCLARRFNILPDDIMVYNGYESGDVLYPGETIQLPSGSRAYIGNRALQYHPASYTVVYGDTLYSIACLFGDVDPRAIAAANDLDVDQSLTAGTVLQIP